MAGAKPTTNTRAALRKRVLKTYGLKVKDGKVQEIKLEVDGDPRKTLSMRAVEQLLGVPLEEVLMSGTYTEISNKTGLKRSTISYWRKRLGLRN
jgi:hypothetical protein